MPEGSLKASPRRSISSRAKNSTSPSRNSPRARLGRDRRPVLPRRDGAIVHNDDRAILENMDLLPFVTPVYKRDLKIEKYFIGYLKHPYMSLYTGPRLQIALHLLPVAADHRRAPLPHAQRRPCDRGDRAGRRPPSRRSRNSSSTTTPSPTTCRARRRSRGNSASSASPGRATPRPMCRARR